MSLFFCFHELNSRKTVDVSSAIQQLKVMNSSFAFRDIAAPVHPTTI